MCRGDNREKKNTPFYIDLKSYLEHSKSLKSIGNDDQKTKIHRFCPKILTIIILPFLGHRFERVLLLQHNRKHRCEE